MKTCLTCLAVLLIALTPLPAGAEVPCTGAMPAAGPAPAATLHAAVRQAATTWQPITTDGVSITSADAEGRLTASALAARIARYADMPAADAAAGPHVGEALVAVGRCPLNDGPAPPAT